MPPRCELHDNPTRDRGHAWSNTGANRRGPLAGIAHPLLLGCRRKRLREPSAPGESGREAFQRWGVEVINDGDCSGAAQGNRRNEITWGVPPERTDDVHEAGFTRLLFQSCPGGCPGGSDSQIVEADILVHPSPPGRFRNTDCLFSTLLHEAGHFLGAPHLASPAVMAPVTSTCPQELTPADREAIGRLYGRS